MWGAIVREAVLMCTGFILGGVAEPSTQVLVNRYLLRLQHSIRVLPRNQPVLFHRILCATGRSRGSPRLDLPPSPVNNEEQTRKIN